LRARRESAGATSLELPEVSVRVIDGEVVIRPLLRLLSRTLVADAMLLAGEAVARFCLDRGIPIPYASQAPARGRQALRPRGLPPCMPGGGPSGPRVWSRARSPTPVWGYSLYTRATSPLRRYSDLLVHQQLRAWLTGRAPLTEQEVTERIAESELAAAAVRRAERLSNLHWKLVYLKEHPDWRGEGVLVAKEERKDVVLVPDLSLETRLRLKGQPGLDSRLRLALRGVDIPGQTVDFRVLV
jgi:exoribonuclease II